MYLSSLELNPRDRRVRHDLADCQEMHRTMLSAWPDFAGGGGARARCGLLYRVEGAQRGGSVRILAQTAEAPAWSRLPERYVLSVASKSIDGFYAALEHGMQIRFRLRANATKRLARGRDDAEQARWAHRRVDLRREEDQIAWLERKGRDQCGFRLLRVQANSDVANVRTQPEDHMTGRRDGRRLTFGSVLFEGELEITDAERFRQALEQGIGSGKAYGFGLLSIAPARGNE